jgi:hypothetical protein
VRHLMTKATCIFIYILFFQTATGQTNSSKYWNTTKQIAEKVISHKLCIGQFVLNPKPLASPSLTLLNKYKNLKALHLTEEDSLNMQMQIDEAVNIRWDSLRLDGVTMLDRDSMQHLFSQVRIPSLQGWDLFHKQYGGGYYQLSVPVFNKDFTFCFLIVQYQCGSLIGARQVWFLTRAGDEWTIEQKLTGNVS